MAIDIAAAIPLALGPFELSWTAILLGLAIGFGIPVAAALIPLWLGTRISVREALAAWGVASVEPEGTGMLARLLAGRGRRGLPDLLAGAARALSAGTGWAIWPLTMAEQIRNQLAARRELARQEERSRVQREFHDGSSRSCLPPQAPEICPSLRTVAGLRSWSRGRNSS